jgi:hypothetical protein
MAHTIAACVRLAGNDPFEHDESGYCATVDRPVLEEPAA